MTLNPKRLAGEPLIEVSLVECPPAGTKGNIEQFPNKTLHEKSTKLAYEDFLYDFIDSCIDRTNQSNLMVCNLTNIFKRLETWKTELPRVKPFYAMKCNTNVPLLKILAASGVNFDCASMFEMKTVIQEVGVDPTRIIFANACKFHKDIKYAAANGVIRTTFDNEMELHKLARHWPNAECVLRILPDHFEAQCDLSTKFGASMNVVPNLLSLAKSLGLNVTGISFHVGSGCFEANAWAESVRLAKRVADTFPDYGFKMNVLDIGGGYPGNLNDLSNENQPTFSDISHYLRHALDEEFPKESGIEIIAEPGRYFASALFTAATEIYGKRSVEENGEIVDQIYIGDGVYGTFNNTVFDHQEVILSAVITPNKSVQKLKSDERETNALNDQLADFARIGDQDIDTVIGSLKHLNAMNSDNLNDESCKMLLNCTEGNMRMKPRKIIFFGPTCDGIDKIIPRNPLPDLNLKCNDWLVWPDMGAYTISAASRFNGMPLPKIYYLLYLPTTEQLELVKSALNLTTETESDML